MEDGRLPTTIPSKSDKAIGHPQARAGRSLTVLPGYASAAASVLLRGKLLRFALNFAHQHD